MIYSYDSTSEIISRFCLICKPEYTIIEQEEVIQFLDGVYNSNNRVLPWVLEGKTSIGNIASEIELEKIGNESNYLFHNIGSFQITYFLKNTEVIGFVEGIILP